MSRPQTRKELAEAGRRKLEAFRKQKAKADSLKPVTKDTNALLAASASASQASSPAAQAASIDAQLVRATSVLPVSTYAQPVSVDGSEEDAPGLLTHNPSAASHPEAVEDRATAASSFASVAAVANSGRTADGGAPDQQAPSPSATPVRIPFTGVTADHSFSRSQQPLPQVAAATATPSATTYRSRLPPPPPVFKPPTSRPQANTLQNSTSSAPGPSANLSPWRPAVLKGSAKGTPFTGQPSGALFSPPSPPPISQFHPTQPGYRHSTASPRHHQLASPSSSKPAGSFSMTRPWEASPELMAPAASSSSVSSGSGTGKEAEAEAVTLPTAQAASQLSLVNERQILPGVSVGPDHSGAETSEAVGSLLTESESGLAATPAREETLTSTPGGMKAAHRFAAEAESPDSPLLFPWSQGPKSTGAASAYASLSDSYLSRPPSQTPSQASSPSKRAQHSTPSSASPPQHARRDAAFAASSPQHAKRSTAKSNAYSTVAMSSSSGPLPPAQRAAQLASHAVSSVFESGASAAPGSSTFSPSANARPSVGAQAAQILSGPPSNGPVSVAPWRQPMVTSSRAQAPLFSPSQADSSSSSGGVLSTVLPDLSSQAQSGARLSSQAALPAQAHETLPGSASPAADAADQDLQQPPSTGPDDSFVAMLQQQQQKPGGLTQEAGVPLLWGRPPHQERSPSSDSLLLPHGRAANGLKGNETDLVSAASSNSNSDSLLSGAADSSRLNSRAVSGSMPSLQKGLGSHVSLADSLANGTLPAKANNFTALQQHIDDLTKEKFELVRGLREQQKVAASLAEENLLVTEDFNRQAEALQQTRKELQQLEGHLQGQQHSMDQLAAERDACKSGAHEAADRSKSLAAEVVALEERVLQVRSRKIRLEKETGRLQEGQEQAEKQLQASRQDRASLQATVDVLQEEKRSLQVKLRQAAAQSDAASTQADAAEMQRASSQQAQPRPTLPRRQQQAAALDSTSATSSGVAADDRREAKSAAEVMDTRQHSGAGASTSSRLADAVLAMHPSPPPQQQAATSSLQGGLSRSLAKLLPKGPGAAEHRQMLESIHAIIGDLEVEKQSFLVTLTSQQAELQTLTVVNSDLQRKLESQTQRLELAIQQQAHASPHAAFSSSSSSVFINGSALHAMRPQLQLSAQTKQPQPGAQWQPSGGLEAASNGGEQTVEEQFSELPPGHGSQYVRSAPPTPQQVAHRPLRAPRGSRPSGVFGWLGNVIAPRPRPQQADLMA